MQRERAAPSTVDAATAAGAGTDRTIDRPSGETA